MITIPYEALFLNEALFLLSQHKDGYFDAGMRALVIEEDDEWIE